VDRVAPVEAMQAGEESLGRVFSASFAKAAPARTQPRMNDHPVSRFRNRRGLFEGVGMETVELMEWMTLDSRNW